MEPKFQTSFIPKKQNVVVSGTINTGAPKKPQVHGTSLFMAIAIFLFVASLGALGGAYFWKYYLTTANTKYKEVLASREKQFNIDLIEKLKAINFQIDSAKKLVSSHIAMSSIFSILESITIADVRFLNLDVKSPAENSGNLTINIRGYGKNLPAVAFQSDVVSDLSQFGLAKVVRNSALRDPVLEANGTVSFNFTAEVDGPSMTYKRALSGSVIEP
jgi:hypothetical protein